MNEITMDQLLRTVVAYKASDLHLVAGSEPQVRIDGKLIPMRVDKFDGTRIQALVYSILTDGQKQRFEENKELDFAFVLAGVGRFRGNVYMQRGSVAAAFRIIPEKTPSIDDLKMPPVIKELVKRERGLILVTGPTGSGKSTTLAAMINEINETEHKHIITIEDPVEFYHNHKNSLVSQRTVGEDTKSFAAALKYALREDPDVILIGEMRDIETIRAALTAAETGHLVFGTLHTNSAIKTINRIINVFPEEEQALVRTQLSLNLTAVIAQALLPKIEGGRIAALEILINNPAISNLIREDKLHQVYAQMQLNQSKTGMSTQTQVLAEYVRQRIIKKEDAIKVSANPDELERTLIALA